MRRSFLKPGRVLLFGGSENDEILMAHVASDRSAQAQVLFKVNLREYETKALGDGANPFFWKTLTVIKEKNSEILFTFYIITKINDLSKCRQKLNNHLH